MAKLWFSIGISGSGKSYYYKNRFLDDFKEVANFLTENNLILSDITVSPDDIRREICGNVSDMSQDNEVWLLAEKKLRENLNTYGYAVFDATGVSKFRKKMLKKYNDVEKIAILFEPNVSLSKERITNDINEGVDRSNVPMFIIDRQFESFKRSIMGGDIWNGIWNENAKSIAYNNLRKEFEEVILV